MAKIERGRERKKSAQTYISDENCSAVDFEHHFNSFSFTLEWNCGFNLCTGNTKLNSSRNSFNRVEFEISAQTKERHS